MGDVKKGHAIGHLVLGAILCFFALMIIILSGVIGSKGDVGAILGPWWVGLMVLIPGILGVVGGITKKKCPTIGFLVLAIIMVVIVGIITALMAIVVAVLGVFKEATKDCIKYGTTCKCSHQGTTFDMNGIDGDCSAIGDIHGLATGVLILMILSILVLFAGSILGCVAVCCNKGSSEGGNTTVIIQQGGNQQPPGQVQQPPPYNQPEAAKY